MQILSSRSKTEFLPLILDIPTKILLGIGGPGFAASLVDL